MCQNSVVALPDHGEKLMIGGEVLYMAESEPSSTSHQSGGTSDLLWSFDNVVLIVRLITLDYLGGLESGRATTSRSINKHNGRVFGTILIQ